VAALKGQARTVLKAMAVVSGTGDGWSSAGVLDGFERACADSLGARCIVSGIDVAPARRVVVSFTVYQVCPPLARRARKRLQSDGGTDAPSGAWARRPCL
jgi:hypothetical protein